MTKAETVRWVYCNQHGRPHRVDEDGSCWCGCIDDWPDVGECGTRLEATSLDISVAAKECHDKALWLS